MDPDLMRGVNWVRCCMCGTLHVEPYPNLARGKDGSLWDVCKGQCARDVWCADEAAVEEEVSDG